MRTVWMGTDEISGLIQQGEGNGAHSYFTEAERVYCAKRKNCLGARFLVKKCVLDYLAHEKGLERDLYRDIEIVNNEKGKPLIRVFGEVQKSLRELYIQEMVVSISHSRHWIAGMVLFSYGLDPG